MSLGNPPASPVSDQVLPSVALVPNLQGIESESVTLAP
jgi:hypothetical protein